MGEIIKKVTYEKESEEAGIGRTSIAKENGKRKISEGRNNTNSRGGR